MNPRKWHLMTWAALLLWLLFSVLANMPFGQDSVSDIYADDLSNTVGVSNVAFSVAIGWPFPYLQHTIRPPSTDVVTDFVPLLLTANVVAVLLTLSSLVFALQRVGQFTVRYLMGVALVVALVIVGGQWVFSAYEGLGVYVMAVALYFSPVVVVLTLGVYRLGRFVWEWGIRKVMPVLYRWRSI